MCIGSHAARILPVFDWRGDAVFAVTALGMEARFAADIDGDLARRMLALSDELSMQLGAPPAAVRAEQGA